MSALGLGLLAVAFVLPMLGNAMPAIPTPVASPFADDYPRPAPPSAPASVATPAAAPSADLRPSTPSPSAVASPGTLTTAASPSSSSIRVGSAPVPQLIDGNGRNVAPASCNQGQGPSPATAPIQFCCPKTLVPYGTDGTGAAGDRYDYRTCPFRIYDSRSGADLENPKPPTSFRFGNPQIAVNPSDEREVAFCSLHGDAVADKGPTPRTRESNQAQTTFTSKDQGITWEDQPPFATPGLGESASCTMDTHGRIYIGYLYSRDNGNETTGYGSALWLLKAGTASEPGSVLSAYGGGLTIAGRTPMNPITNLHVLDVAPYAPPAATASNGTYGPPANATELGDSAVDEGNATAERVGAVWFERCTEYVRNVTNPCHAAQGMPGWIDAAFAGTGPSDDWHRLTNNQLIGPCMDASNPVAFNGQVYVACVVEKGYNARSRARIGDVDIWRIDPQSGNTTVLEWTGLRGGHPLLATTHSGYMVLVTTKFVGTTGATIQAAFGWYGRGWNTLGVDLGPQLHRMAGPLDVRDAGVLALSISETEKTSILEYMEWQNVTQPGQVPAVPPVDPNNPVPATPALKDFKKMFMTFNSCNPSIAAAKMELGTGVDPDNFDAYTDRPSIFDDSQDGIQSYTEPAGGDLFYFAVNDYGAMQYGTVLTSAASTLCVVPQPLPPAPPLPIPQALTVSNGALAQVGAVVGATAVAGVLYLVTAKRRMANLAVAEAK